MADVSDDGWVDLGNRSTWRGLDGSSTRLAALSLFSLPLAAMSILRTFVSPPVAWGLGLGLVAVLGVVFILIGRVLLHRRVRVNVRRGELAVGKRTVAFSSVNRASVGYEIQRRTLSVYLVFGEDSHPMGSVCLRSAVVPELNAEQRHLVADLLRHSRVELPTAKPDPYDPKGKFAWMEHPNSLTRSEAIEFVLNTPESGEPLRGEPRPTLGFED